MAWKLTPWCLQLGKLPTKLFFYKQSANLCIAWQLKQRAPLWKCHSVAFEHTRLQRRDRLVKTELNKARARPCPSCDNQRMDACQPFSERELLDQLRKLKMRKALGPDEVCAEHICHLGPVARGALLQLINRSWASSEVPSSWRRAHTIPILKTGKYPKEMASYRPISLTTTSHLAKLAERMVSARLTHLMELKKLIPLEQVGFRRGRAAEENLARLIQTVQDGWNRPQAKGRPVDGKTADKCVLLAFDFSRAYDLIDHNMLYLKMTHHLPLCMAKWIFHFLRDRRARAEVNGVRSSERRSGAPSGVHVRR